MEQENVVYAAITNLNVKNNLGRHYELAGLLLEMSSCGDVMEFVPMFGMYGLYFEEYETNVLLGSEELTFLEKGSLVDTGKCTTPVVRVNYLEETILLYTGEEYHLSQISASALVPGTFYLDALAFLASEVPLDAQKHTMEEADADKRFTLPITDAIQLNEYHQVAIRTNYRVRCFDSHCGDEYDIPGEFTFSAAQREVEKGNAEFLSGGIWYYSVESRESKETKAIEEMEPWLAAFFHKEK